MRGLASCVVAVLGLAGTARADIIKPPHVETLASPRGSATARMVNTDDAAATPEPKRKLSVADALLGYPQNREVTVSTTADGGARLWKRIVAARVKPSLLSDDGRYLFGLCMHGEDIDHVAVVEAGSEKLFKVTGKVDPKSLAFDPATLTVSVVTLKGKTLTFKLN